MIKRQDFIHELRKKEHKRQVTVESKYTSNKDASITGRTEDEEKEE